MEEWKKNDPVSKEAEECEDLDEEIFDGEEKMAEDVDEEIAAQRRSLARIGVSVKKKTPRIAIFARYLFPAVFGLVLFAISFTDGVYFYMNGRTMKMSLFAFYKNTLTAAHDYLAGTTETQANWFYGLLSGGAILFALIYLLALGFAVLAAVTACRTFLAKPESEICARMKMIFKIAFPNRVFLYLSNLLFLIPVLYPEYFSAVGGRFLLIGGRETVYVETNVYLIVTAVFLVLMAGLSFLISKWERQKNMNMFLIDHLEEDEALVEDE